MSKCITCIIWSCIIWLHFHISIRLRKVYLLAVVNLVEGIDVPAIEARIAEYQRENAEQIMVAQARKVLRFSLYAIVNLG